MYVFIYIYICEDDCTGHPLVFLHRMTQAIAAGTSTARSLKLCRQHRHLLPVPAPSSIAPFGGCSLAKKKPKERVFRQCKGGPAATSVPRPPLASSLRSGHDGIYHHG